LTVKQVTIGLPVYNGANYLAAALDSILAQSYGDFDLLISDNASTDGTEEICRAYIKRDLRIRYIRRPSNLGAAPNYNVLVQMSESPYFKWAAHDDLLAPGFLGACVEALDRDSAAVLAFTASTLIDDNGAPLTCAPERGGMVDRTGLLWSPWPEKNDGLMAREPTLRFEALMLNMAMCVEVFGVMRRSALVRTCLIGGFCGADKVMLAQMSLLGHFWLGQETLFSRRCHAQQYSSQYNALASAPYRAEWLAGRRESNLTQNIKLLLAYYHSINATELTARQRATCFRAIVRRALSSRTLKDRIGYLSWAGRQKNAHN
jgi:glycosyltransferase involved in cell wall biosynthesis